MTKALVSFSAICLLAMVVFAAPTAGDQAPAFSATDSNGKTHNLSDYKGKYVVLEWTNSGCPFTKKHYASGNMQKLQKQWTSKGVVWLSVISSAPGKEGYKTPAEENAYLNQVNASPTAVLMDPKGDLGHTYGAKTTPHMFIIDPNGKLIYAGAIDNKPSTDRGDIDGARNYLNAALTEAMAGKAVTTASTQAYGCSVKYASGD
jgi:peroxiredoxin